jgi:hypothetical protein
MLPTTYNKECEIKIRTRIKTFSYSVCPPQKRKKTKKKKTTTRGD